MEVLNFKPERMIEEIQLVNSRCKKKKLVQKYKSKNFSQHDMGLNFRTLAEFRNFKELEHRIKLKLNEFVY